MVIGRGQHGPTGNQVPEKLEDELKEIDKIVGGVMRR